jgi:hypothetical protein
MTKSPKPEDQVKIFRKAARAIEADESEAAFDAALGKIARHKPKPDVEKARELTEKSNPNDANELARAIGNKDD